MLQDFPIVPNFWRSFHPIVHKFVIIFPLADLLFYGVSWSTVNGIHTHVYTHTHTLIHIQRHIHPTYTHIHTIHYMIHINMNMRIDMHIHYPYTFIHTYIHTHTYWERTHFDGNCPDGRWIHRCFGPCCHPIIFSGQRGIEPQSQAAWAASMPQTWRHMGGFKDVSRYKYGFYRHKWRHKDTSALKQLGDLPSNIGTWSRNMWI